MIVIDILLNWIHLNSYLQSITSNNYFLLLNSKFGLQIISIDQYRMMTSKAVILITYTCYFSWRSLSRPPGFSNKPCPGQSLPLGTKCYPFFHVFLQFPTQCVPWSSSFFFIFRILS